MEEKIAKRLDAFPYPVLALAENGKILYRNRMAKGLLPSQARLRGLFDQKGDVGERLLDEICLDETTYLVLTVSEEENLRLLCFFENFLPLQAQLSRVIFGQMQDFFWLLMHQETEGEHHTSLPDRISAQVCTLQKNAEDYLRLLDVCRLAPEEKKLCSLEGFFGHLQKALSVRGIDAAFRFPEKACAVSEGVVLSYLVLNLLHFVRLYESDRETVVRVKVEGDHLRFSASFSDRGGIAAALEGLVRNGRGDEELLSVLPLLCMLRVCMDRGISWEAVRRGGKFVFSFLLEKGRGEPVLFLSDAAAKEVADLTGMVKTIFS